MYLISPSHGVPYPTEGFKRTVGLLIVLRAIPSHSHFPSLLSLGAEIYERAREGRGSGRVGSGYWQNGDTPLRWPQPIKTAKIERHSRSRCVGVWGQVQGAEVIRVLFE